MRPDLSGHLGLNFEKDAAHCVRCNWGRRGLRQWLTGLQIASLPARFVDVREGITSLRQRIDKPAAEFRHVPALLPDGIVRLREDDFDEPGRVVTSLLDKGIAPAEMLRHRLCHCPGNKRLGAYAIFPFIEDAEVVYWQGRHASPNAKMRKLNPYPDDAPMGKKHWLYGFELASKGSHLVLVEGQLDAITVTSWLDANGGGCALALSGTALSFPDPDTHPLNTHFGKLAALAPERITVLFDQDAQAKARALAQLLASCGLPAKAGELIGYKDANDAHSDPDAIARALAGRSRLQLVRDKLTGG